jgi:hypothetical protein
MVGMAAREPGAAPAGGCALSSRKSFRAFSVDDYLLIVATLDIGAGYDLHLHRSLLPSATPEFTFEACRRPGVWPLSIQTDVHTAEIFCVGRRPDSVRVHHAAGVDDVPVEALVEELSAFGATLPARSPDAAALQEATGYSTHLSFDEAFANAHTNLPPFQPAHPDQLERLTVVETGALFGGFAGFHHLYVRIRRSLE